MKIKVTEEFLIENSTSNLAWTAKQLKILNVNWPPYKGWKRDVLKNNVFLEEDEAALFIGYSILRKKNENKHLQ